LSFTATAGSVVIAGIPSPLARNWSSLAPDLPDKLRQRRYGSSRIESFSQVIRELRVSYGTLRHLLEREIDEEALGFIQGEDEIYLGIDEHSFRHHEMVYTVTEVKKRRVLGIPRDDRIATLKEFLSKIPEDKVKEVCIDTK